jgi:2-keto-3-deoxy-L-rhamnonate aldolase RhmA
VIVQIETQAALEQLPQIAAVPGVDAIFIGPSDLAASMGMLGDTGNAAVQEQLKRGAQLCKQVNKPCGIIGPNPESVATFVDYGYSWIAIGSDMSFMVGRGQEWLARARGHAPVPAKAQAGY